MQGIPGPEKCASAATEASLLNQTFKRLKNCSINNVYFHFNIYIYVYKSSADSCTLRNYIFEKKEEKSGVVGGNKSNSCD